MLHGDLQGEWEEAQNARRMERGSRWKEWHLECHPGRRKTGTQKRGWRGRGFLKEVHCGYSMSESRRGGNEAMYPRLKISLG